MRTTGFWQFNGLPKEIMVGLLGVALTVTIGVDLAGSPMYARASAAPSVSFNQAGKISTPTTSTTVTTAPPTTTTLPPVTVPAAAATPSPARTVSRPVAPPKSVAKPPPTTVAPPAPPGPARNAKTIPLGDYAGWVTPSGIASFASKTGAHVSLASDYLDRVDGWAAMASGGGEGGWHSSGLRLVLGVPVIPGGSGGSLASGATGAYNPYFATLAQNLVAQGEGNAILRLGWEFNGTWYPWSVASNGDAQNFAAFWRQIVSTMRAVPGQSFAFLWNPNSGGNQNWDLAQAYPGSGYVDYIGTDVYDEFWGSPKTPQNSWSSLMTESWGLNWLSAFAAAQGRPIAMPEWSVTIRSDGYGMGDDPYFITQFGNWIASNNVAFTCMFAFNDTAGGQDNDITDGNFPNALAAFRAVFG